MKLSRETIEVLKNFAVINSNIAFSTDNVLRTVAVSKNLMAKASIAETFPYEFGIYDLSEFLSALTMFEEPTLEFDENMKHVNIVGGNSSIKYFFSDKSNLVITDKEPKMPEAAVDFTLTNAQLNTIRKASSALKAEQLVVSPGLNGDVNLTVTDTNNPTSNEFKLSVKTNIIKDTDFKFIMNIGNFKFSVNDEYKFTITDKHISSIETASTLYWLALEKK